MPEHECSSWEKRRGPSERSWTRRAVHFAPMISAEAATAQVDGSWTAFIVREAAGVAIDQMVLAKGAGQAAIFGIEKRAIVPKPSAGLHACATPASQATDRKMNASSIEKPCSSTSRRAAPSETSESASAKSYAVACGS